MGEILDYGIGLELPERDVKAPPASILFYRGGIVESLSRAYCCIVKSTGELILSIGNAEQVSFLRSSAKPLQALSVITSGAADKFGFSAREISLMSGSHGGEDIHVETVRSILAKIGLNESALQCGAHPPLAQHAREVLQERHIEPQPVHHNCSGKHSGMLATAVHLGIDSGNYLSRTSKVQEIILKNIAEIADIDAGKIRMGIDGCTAPVHALPMRNAALAFARLVDPDYLPVELADAARKVTKSMRECPEMVAATKDRICTELIRGGRKTELIAKGGAEGYYAAAWIDQFSGKGMGLALKIEDGSQRGRDPLVISLLQKAGALDEELPDNLKPLAETEIKNHRGIVVGKIAIGF